MNPTHPQHESELADEHAAPGGKSINRAATVVTSAALGGAAAGALAGTVAGPVGTVVGAAVGALAAGAAGNAIASSVDAEAEQRYWRENYAERPYVDPSADYADYAPAYDYGVGSFVQHQGRDFDDVEEQLAREWTRARGSSSLDWDRARPASRDAWERVQVRVVRQRD